MHFFEYDINDLILFISIKIKENLIYYLYFLIINIWNLYLPIKGREMWVKVKAYFHRHNFLFDIYPTSKIIFENKDGQLTGIVKLKNKTDAFVAFKVLPKMDGLFLKSRWEPPI